MNQPLAVVVVAYNSEHVIDALLDSLPAALDGLSAQVVVVDNGSTDGTPDRIRLRADCVLVQETNRGYAAGINAGVDALGGEGAILVLNPDLRLAPRCVRYLVEGLGDHVGVVAPKVLDGDGELVLSLRREPTLLRAVGLGSAGHPAVSEYVTDRDVYERPAQVDWALGAVLLVARKCHEDLGGWDESFFLYSEETDFCLRAKGMGWVTRYEPRAEATHTGAGSGQSPQTHAMQIVNRVRFYARGHGDASSSVYLSLAALSELSWLARGHRHSWTSFKALVQPSARPAQLGIPRTFIPR